MRFQLNGSVEVTFKIRGEKSVLCMFFDAEDFSRIDVDEAFSLENGETVYRGLFDAVEDNIQVRLRVVALRRGFREKVWEVLTIRQNVVDLAIGSDQITFEFLESED